jgi:PASTA domain
MLHRFPAARTRPILFMLGAAVAALLTLTVSTGTARAACGSSTPASVSFPDPAADAGAGAPEITSVDASLDAGCRLTIEPKLAAPLNADQAVLIQLGFLPDEFVDRDIIVVQGVPPFMFDGSSPPNPIGPLTAVGSAGFTATVDEVGLTGSTSLGIFVVTVYDPTPTTPGDETFDEASAGGNFLRFPVAFQPPSPPPPPPPPPPSPPASVKPATPPANTQASACVVPKLKGLTVKKAKAALKKAGCKYKLKGKGRVRSFSPKAGTRTNGTVQVKCKQKKRKKKRARR